MAKRSSASCESAKRRERLQLVLVIGRLVIEALKALHSGRFGGGGPGWPTRW